MLATDTKMQPDLHTTDSSVSGSNCINAACFEIQLSPLTGMHAPTNSSSVKYTQRHDLSGINIVYVDDDVILCRLLPGLLRHVGASVTAIHNDKLSLQQILEKIPQNTNLLISDYSMDGANGITLIEAIKKKHPNIVCLLTSASTQENVIANLDIPFMPKGLTPQERTSFLVNLCQKNGL